MPQAARSLDQDERLHYQRVVGALKETVGLMGMIDSAIDEYGGWGGVLFTD
jgi:hypothetical protein